MQYSETPIAVVGLGYVGLPLAVEFGAKRKVIGFDTNEVRITELNKGVDNTLETTNQELKDAIYLSYTNSLKDIKDCKIFIITVPTPIDKNKQPNLSPLKDASEAIGSILKKGDLVIYESTVYPGATEEDCIPILEKMSNLLLNQDFSVGYGFDDGLYDYFLSKGFIIYYIVVNNNTFMALSWYDSITYKKCSFWITRPSLRTVQIRQQYCFTLWEMK